jgi:uncharacterized protein (UPF0333 family)
MVRKGQLSAEMLVVLVLVLGVAIFLASVMFKSAGQAGGKIEQKTEQVLNSSEMSAAKLGAGEYCSADSQCESGDCTASKCR